MEDHLSRLQDSAVSRNVWVPLALQVAVLSTASLPFSCHWRVCPETIRVLLPPVHPEDLPCPGCSRSRGRYPLSSALARHRRAGSPWRACVPVWELIPATSARLFAILGVSGCREGMARYTGDTCVPGGWCVLGLPVQGSTCARRLLQQVCACTDVFSVASKAPGGDKWHLGTPTSHSALGFGNPAGRSGGFGWDLPVLV